MHLESRSINRESSRDTKGTYMDKTHKNCTIKVFNCEKQMKFFVFHTLHDF